MFVFLKSLLPLFCLHVAKAQSATCRCIIWELSQCPLVLLCCLCPLTIPAVAIGCIHCCAEDLSVPRHEIFTFSIVLTSRVNSAVRGNFSVPCCLHNLCKSYFRQN